MRHNSTHSPKNIRRPIEVLEKRQIGSELDDFERQSGRSERPSQERSDQALSIYQAASIRTPVNNIEYFPPNFEGLVLGCIDADFCK